jgi:hypothetical protein
MLKARSAVLQKSTIDAARTGLPVDQPTLWETQFPEEYRFILACRSGVSNFQPIAPEACALRDAPREILSPHAGDARGEGEVHSPSRFPASSREFACNGDTSNHHPSEPGIHGSIADSSCIAPAELAIAPMSLD